MTDYFKLASPASPTDREPLTPEQQDSVDDVLDAAAAWAAENPITMRKSGILDLTEYESRGAALTALGMVRRRRRSPDMRSVRIPLLSRKYPGLYAIVDESDAEFVRQWEWLPLVSPRKNKTRITAVLSGSHKGAVSQYMHRVLLGVSDPRIQVDHINLDTLDNRRSNLRIVTNQQNAFNQAPRRGTSRFKGVCWHKSVGKWNAQIGHNGRVRSLGVFESEIDAARAYDEAALRLFGEFARTNESMGLLVPDGGDA